MRRPTVHRAFAVATLALLVAGGWQAFALFQHQREVAAVGAVPPTLDAAPATDQWPASAGARLATASALSSGGQFDAAESALVRLIDEQGDSPLGRAAQFNLANHYLRQAGSASQPTGAALPLLGVAKQRYRDLLLRNPDDWDARYNLERALALAPEGGDEPLEDKQVHQRANVVVPDFEQLDLP